MSESYLRFGDDHLPYKIKSDEVIPAVQLYTLSYTNDTVDLGRFYYVNMSVINKTLYDNGTWIYTASSAPAELCTELFPKDKYPTVYSQFKNDNDPNLLASTEWFCFPEGDFEVFNDAVTQPEGITSGLAVYNCDPTIEGSDCETDPELL